MRLLSLSLSLTSSAAEKDLCSVSDNVLTSFWLSLISPRICSMPAFCFRRLRTTSNMRSVYVLRAAPFAWPVNARAPGGERGPPAGVLQSPFAGR